MLVLLLGPSGVGKTSIIQVLAETYGWSVIPSYITRPARKDEQHKRTLSVQEYQRLLEEGRFFSHVEQLNHMYGTLRTDIELAQRSDEAWLLDFAVCAYKKSFVGIEHFSFVILPESHGQLETQLMEAGRLERLAGAIELLSKIENSDNRQALGLDESTIVINHSNRVNDAAASIADTVGHLSSRRFS